MPRAERSNATGHFKVITVNRRAYHDYDILETVEAGLVLTGTEIKSVRAARVNIQHAFARMEGGEMWLFNCHISQYPQGNIYNHDPTRTRKLLMHHKEIGQLAGTAAQQGLTLIPLRLYIKGHVAKVQVGLARGRKLHDKRPLIIDGEQEREIGRTLRSAARG